MSYESRIDTAWRNNMQLASKLATARDGYLPISTCEDRFMLLEDAYEAANRIGDGTSIYFETKKPFLGRKPDEAVAIILEAVGKLYSVIEQLALDDQRLRQVARDGELSNDQKIIVLQARVNRKDVPEDKKQIARELLAQCVKARREEVIQRIEGRGKRHD